MPKARGLTPKQARFVDEYMIDLNATQAAIRSGYSAKTASWIGPQLLAKTHVVDEIRKSQAARSRRTEITADYVLTTIRDTVERCRQAEPVMTKNDDGDLVESGAFKFDAPAVLKGCELLGRHLKLFTDKSELTGPGGAPLVVKVIYVD